VSKKKQYVASLDELVLLKVMHSPGVSASQLFNALKEMACIAGIYQSTKRLEEKGFLFSSLEKPTKRRGGRAYRAFYLHQEGFHALQKTERLRESLVEKNA
jgi:hypothetical protein